MRTKNSVKNIYIGILTQVVVVLLGFISRKVFIDSLGTEYLGVNGLLTNILSMLGLVEGGIGTSIIYNLYRPLAEKDTEKITALIQLYKKLYIILAIIVFLLGIAIYPLLNMIIKGGTTVRYIGIVYFILIFKSVISYLNAHKWSLINADQKGYIIAKYSLVFNIVTTIIKIVVLKLTKNYILFLLIETIIFIIENIYNGNIVNRMYPYIKTKEKYEVDKNTKENLVMNVKAVFLHKIGSYCVFGTDNILISAFVNIKAVGLYSNYTMITTQLVSLLTPIIGGIGDSVGNLIATEDKEKSYDVFKMVFLVNFFIYSISAIFLFNLLEPFISFWLGKGLLLDKLSFIFIIVNFYITGMRSSVDIFKAKAGIFDPDKYMPLLEAIINLVASLILIKYFGITGIFMGTMISTIAIPLWNQPRLVYKNIFKKSVLKYFEKYIGYLFLTIIIGGITTFVCSKIFIENILVLLVIKGIICILFPVTIYILVLHKSKEYIELKNIVIPILNKIINKFSNNFNKSTNCKEM